MSAVTICSDFGAQKNKVWHCLHFFPIYFLWSDGTGCHDLSFLSIKQTFSLSYFTFIKKELFSSSLSAIRLVSSAYLRLLIFLPAILIPACASSSPAFVMNDVTRCDDLSCLNIEFYTSYLTFLFHFYKELFSSSSLSAIRVVSSAYLRLLILLLAILIPACASSNLAFHMMYSA